MAMVSRAETKMPRLCMLGRHSFGHGLADCSKWVFSVGLGFCGAGLVIFLCVVKCDFCGGFEKK